jgi:hypothetical protein
VEALLAIGIEILRLVPLVLLFYIPALMAVAIWKERGPGYQRKAALIVAVGFGAVVGVQLLFRSTSVLQVAGVVGLSALQLAVAAALAALTVYKLAD